MNSPKSKKLLWDLFMTFAKIGLFAFGGGYVMIPMIQKEASESHDWIPKDEIANVISVSSSMPGAIAMNASVYVGYNVAGYVGAICALVGCIFPSIIIMLLVSIFMMGVIDNPYFLAALKGIIPVVTGLMITAMVKLGKNSIKDFGGLFIFLTALFISIFSRNLVIYVLVGSALFGVVFSCKQFSNVMKKPLPKIGDKK